MADKEETRVVTLQDHQKKTGSGEVLPTQAAKDMRAAVEDVASANKSAKQSPVSDAARRGGPTV